MTTKVQTITVEEDPETGDLILPLNPDLLAQMGWDIGDDLVWEEHMPGASYVIRKADKPSAVDDAATAMMESSHARSS